MLDACTLRGLPKTDLHCHLDGSLRPATLLDLAPRLGVELPSYTEEGLRELVYKDRYADLADYLRGFAYTSAVLRDEEALERVAWELGRDCLDEGVVYLEVRVAPQLHVVGDLDITRVLAAVDRGLDRARREDERSEAVRYGRRPSFRYGIIACAMRAFSKGFGPWYQDLLEVVPGWPPRQAAGVSSLSLASTVIHARDHLGIPVVGFDLAGAEAGYPASDHIAAYDYAHEHFLGKSVIAGEAYGPESIFQALTLLHADRIGHGTSLFAAEEVGADEADPQHYVDRLVEYLSDRRIALEVCLSSNLMTHPELATVAEHPVGRMLDARLSVTLCTDNRLMAHTTVSRELALATQAFGLDARAVRNLLVHGFKRSFYPGSYREKRTWVRELMDALDRELELTPGS